MFLAENVDELADFPVSSMILAIFVDEKSTFRGLKLF
jgi:hypothetical protein